MTLYAEQVSRAGRAVDARAAARRPGARPRRCWCWRTTGRVSTSGQGRSLRLVLTRWRGAPRQAHRTTDYSRAALPATGASSVGVEGSINRKNRFRSPKEELTPGSCCRPPRRPRAAGRTRALPHGAAQPAGRTRWRRWPSRCWATPLAMLGAAAVGRAWGYLLPWRLRALLPAAAALREPGHRRAGCRCLAGRRRPTSIFMRWAWWPCAASAARGRCGETRAASSATCALPRARRWASSQGS